MQAQVDKDQTKTDLTRLPHSAFLEPLSYRPQWTLQWHECSLQRVVGDLEKHPQPPEQTHQFQTSATRSKFIRQDIGLTVAYYSGEVIHISSLALLKVWLSFQNAQSRAERASLRC